MVLLPDPAGPSMAIRRGRCMLPPCFNERRYCLGLYHMLSAPNGSVSGDVVSLVAVLCCLLVSMVVRGFRSVLLSTWLVKKMFRCQSEVGVRDEFEQRKHLIGFQMASKPCVASIRL